MTHLYIDEKYGDFSISKQIFEEYLLDEYSYENKSISNLAETLEKFQEDILSKKHFSELLTPLAEKSGFIKTSVENEQSEKLNEDVKQIKKRFYCTHNGCNKSYSVDKVLQSHLKGHTETKLYNCNYLKCGKIYKSKENLNLHIKNKHLGVKPYKCTYCTSTFTHRNGKTYHERRLHSHYLPYKCEIKSCDKSFASKSSLNYHLKNKH